MIVLETERLRLRHLSPETDGEFILKLLNEPPFLRYIGDKGVRTLEDARDYIRNGPMKSYEQHGFGLYKVEKKKPKTRSASAGWSSEILCPTPILALLSWPRIGGKVTHTKQRPR